MGELTVELSGSTIGRLVGTWRTFDFHADPSAVDRFGIGSTALSVAVPLLPRTTGRHRDRRQNFFAGLLPEGRMLDRLASRARVPAHDTVGLLRQYGRDVAGALQIWDPALPGEPRTPAVELLDETGVARIIAEVGREPLGNRAAGGKTSLAGVQDKVVLARLGDRWARVIDGYPSTHILKPVSTAHPTMVFDEQYGARLARAVGLARFDTRLASFDGRSALVIERYDRDVGVSPARRVHQEDLAQALGVTGAEKYQRHGGTVSLARIAALFLEHGVESAEKLLRIVTLAVAIGNLDLHAKNLSLLHHDDQTIELADAYDVVPMTHHDTDGEVALAVGQEYRHAAITRTHLLDEAASWRLRDAARIVDETIEGVRQAVRSLVPDDRAHPGLVTDIARFTENLATGRAVGLPTSVARPG